MQFKVGNCDLTSEKGRDSAMFLNIIVAVFYSDNVYANRKKSAS